MEKKVLGICGTAMGSKEGRLDAVTREGMWKRQWSKRLMGEGCVPWAVVLIPYGITESLEGSCTPAPACLWNGKKLQGIALKSVW